MTTTPTAPPTTAGVDDVDPIRQAVDALTRAATTSDGSAGGVDFADIAARVLTAVAANVGGLDQLLAGRPGSWEADLVRQLVHGTAGDQPSDLLAHRTAPVQLTLGIEQAFSDLGLTTLFDEASAQLGTGVETAEAALIDACATEDERARLAELEATMPPMTAPDTVDRARWVAMMTEAGQIVDTIDARATTDQHPAAGAYAQARAATDALFELWTQDQATYATAYLDQAKAYLTEHGATCPVELVEYDRDTYRWDPLVEAIEDHARATTALPMTAQRPNADTNPADAVRAAARTYLDRVRAQQP